MPTDSFKERSLYGLNGNPTAAAYVNIFDGNVSERARLLSTAPGRGRHGRGDGHESTNCLLSSIISTQA